MTNLKVQKERLIRRDGLNCHYCDKECLPLSKQNHPLHPTIEHIIPKSRGGGNYMRNYVLACSKCNSRRGNEMFYCECSICAPLYDEYTQTEILRMYMMERVRVKKGRDGRWVMVEAGRKRFFPTWERAMAAAIEMTKVEI